MNPTENNQCIIFRPSSRGSECGTCCVYRNSYYFTKIAGSRLLQIVCRTNWLGSIPTSGGQLVGTRNLLHKRNNNIEYKIQ